VETTNSSSNSLTRNFDSSTHACDKMECVALNQTKTLNTTIYVTHILNETTYVSRFSTRHHEHPSSYLRPSISFSHWFCFGNTSLPFPFKENLNDVPLLLVPKKLHLNQRTILSLMWTSTPEESLFLSTLLLLFLRGSNHLFSCGV